MESMPNFVFETDVADALRMPTLVDFAHMNTYSDDILHAYKSICDIKPALGAEEHVHVVSSQFHTLACNACAYASILMLFFYITVPLCYHYRVLKKICTLLNTSGLSSFRWR